MRDDFESVVADRFTVLDDVAVPDTWSRVQHKLLDPIPDDSIDAAATMIDLERPNPTRELRMRRRWVLAAAAVVLLVAAAVVLVERDPEQPAVVTTHTPPDTTTAPVESSFAAAIEASGLLIKPSAEEIALASNPNFYGPESGSTQISAAESFASLQKRTTGWAYVTGSVDGSEVHRGWLGAADAPEVYVLDDRFFVATEGSPGSQQAPTAWLIDSVSGQHAELTWREEPTTVSTVVQALVLSDGEQSVARKVRQQASSSLIGEVFLPRVVDARDGTIRPLAVPDNASVNLPVVQNGEGRIWIGTAPDGRPLETEELDVVQAAGYAYSDDGGATWTEVTIPPQLFAAERLAEKDSWGASIAADGDRIAVTSAWSYNLDRYVYVSDDAGLSWSTVTVANPSRNNGAQLYVLADKRLLLVRSDDPYAAQLLASAGPDWTTLEDVPQDTQSITIKNKYVSVNRDGIALMYFPVEVYDDGNIGNNPDAPTIRHHFSTDLTNWRTIAVLDD